MELSRVAAAALAFAVAALAQQTPDDAQRALQEGNRRFAADRSVLAPIGEGARRTLARGESPRAIVLCCSDSRVPPEHVFNAGLGELFVVRVAGHTCDAETLASIEHAVEQLNVPLAVVLAHEGCGAISSAITQANGKPPHRADAVESFALHQLLEQLEPAVRRASARELRGGALCTAAEEEHAHHTVHECLRRSELLRRYTSVGRFRMVAARYHLHSGEVEWLPSRPPPPDPAVQREVPPGAVPFGVPPHVALRLLQAGHRRFLGEGEPSGDLSSVRREALTHGQQPLAIVLSCSDSRTAPEHVFDAGLGELSVIRVAGNTLNDDVLASIELAASRTGAPLLVVMGHTHCSALRAAADQPQVSDLSPNKRTLLMRLEPSIELARASAHTGDALIAAAAKLHVLRTVAEARSRSALLRQLEAAGRLALLPVIYDLETGDLEWLKDANAAEPAAAPAVETRVIPQLPAPLPLAATETPAPVPDRFRPSPAPPAAAPAGQARHENPRADEEQAREWESFELTSAAWGHDKRLLIGLCGIASLSLAALLLLRRRG